MYNDRKRMLLPAAFDVRLCFTRRMIKLTMNIPGLNRALLSYPLYIKASCFTYVSVQKGLFEL